MIALIAAVTVALPTNGVAVQSHGSVELVRLDGSVARTLPGWRIAPYFPVAVGTVFLRDRAHAVWRLRAGRLERVPRVVRPRIRAGCFSTMPHTKICGYPYGAGRSRILVDGAVARGSQRAHGRWLLVDVGPRGRLLAQWSGECEVPTAYVGATSRLVPVYPPPVESFALGWAGVWAVVAFPVAGCGSEHHRAGVYVGRRWIHSLRRGDVAALWR